MTESLASLLGAADPTLSIENVLWTHILSEWLGWPHPPQNRKKSKTPKITRHNMHLPCFLFKKKKKNQKCNKVSFSFAQNNSQRSTTGEQSLLVKKAKNVNTQGQ